MATVILGVSALTQSCANGRGVSYLSPAIFLTLRAASEGGAMPLARQIEFRNLARVYGCQTGAMWLLIAAFAAARADPSVTTLHAFCSRQSCADGFRPTASLAKDANGNFYGTTSGGGAHNNGTAFELRWTGSAYKYRVIHDFCRKALCEDGGTPDAKLVVDVNGNLYGTTLSGGLGGTAFKLSPDATHTRWKYIVLYAFCARPRCADGVFPAAGLTYRGAAAGLLYDGVSPLFGTTNRGDESVGSGGTVYQLLFRSGRTKPAERVIYNFCSQPDCADGKIVDNGLSSSILTMDGEGHLFGTTVAGGIHGNGVVFRLSPRKNGFADITLYSFCRLKNCVDGSEPSGALILDGHGRLIGTTLRGGMHGAGTVFRIDRLSRFAEETVLYDFCALSNCADGGTPQSGVIMDSHGDFFGVTGSETVFRLRRGSETTLANLCPEGGCDLPQPGLAFDAAGNLLGTEGGGNGTAGTVFELAR